MESWIPYIVIGIAFVIIIGNLSTFKKSSHHKMRKKSLNELQETLPRTQRTEHKMKTVKKEPFTPKK